MILGAVAALSQNKKHSAYFSYPKVARAVERLATAQCLYGFVVMLL